MGATISSRESHGGGTGDIRGVITVVMQGTQQATNKAFHNPASTPECTLRTELHARLLSFDVGGAQSD